MFVMKRFISIRSFEIFASKSLISLTEVQKKFKNKNLDFRGIIWKISILIIELLQIGQIPYVGDF